MTDARLHAPAAERNRDPILTVLRPALADCRTVLEVASGSGTHVVHLALALPGIVFQPTDVDPMARSSIDAVAADAGLDNVRPALALNAAVSAWPVAQADAVLCVNMIHIAPWAAGLGLLRGAARVLPPGGLLFLYGPFKRDGQHTAPSNAAFDAGLRQRDPAWGVRDLETVTAAAEAAGFLPPRVIAMPANNLSVLFRRGTPSDAP